MYKKSKVYPLLLIRPDFRKKSQLLYFGLLSGLARSDNEGLIALPAETLGDSKLGINCLDPLLGGERLDVVDLALP